MKKENYVCLVLGIIALGLWVINVFKLGEILAFIQVGYIMIGFPVSLTLFACAWPTTSSNKTKKSCNICGKVIMKDEQSIHFNRKDEDGNTFDYCEKCKDKVKD